VDLVLLLFLLLLLLQGQMWRGADPVLVLRLLCLLSWTGGGLPRKHGDSLRSEFLAAYGHQHLLTLNNLERAGRGCTEAAAAPECHC
jgi:hypothetical protein